MEQRNDGNQSTGRIIQTAEDFTGIIKNSDTLLASQLPQEPSPDPLADA